MIIVWNAYFAAWPCKPYRQPITPILCCTCGLQMPQSTYSRSTWVHAYATDLHVNVDMVFMNSELLVHLRTSINLVPLHKGSDHA